MALDPITAVLQLGSSLIDRLWPDPTEAAKAKLELLKLQETGELAQITGQLEINKQEATSSSVFVAGWRPGLGWVCGLAFSLHFVLFPITNFILVMWGHKSIDIEFDMSTLTTVLFGMLGLGGLRTFEKVKGVS